MMKFDNEYFSKFKFTNNQIRKNYDNAVKDLAIAKKDEILEVKFNYAYTALIKGGVALLSLYGFKIRSIPGHHVKILEKMGEILKDDSIIDIGNVIRSKRNIDLYAGGVEVTEKECIEYVEFVGKTLQNIKNRIIPE